MRDASLYARPRLPAVAEVAAAWITDRVVDGTEIEAALEVEVALDLDVGFTDELRVAAARAPHTPLLEDLSLAVDFR